MENSIHVKHPPPTGEGTGPVRCKSLTLICIISNFFGIFEVSFFWPVPAQGPPSGREGAPVPNTASELGPPRVVTRLSAPDPILNKKGGVSQLAPFDWRGGRGLDGPILGRGPPRVLHRASWAREFSKRNPFSVGQ